MFFKKKAKPNNKTAPQPVDIAKISSIAIGEQVATLSQPRNAHAMFYGNNKVHIVCGRDNGAVNLHESFHVATSKLTMQKGVPLQLEFVGSCTNHNHTKAYIVCGMKQLFLNTNRLQ